MHYRKLTAPLSVQIELTEKCNNNCIHCYNHWREGGNLSLKTLSQNQLSHIADVILTNKIFSVTLTGGEPLLYWELLPDFVSKLVKGNIQVSLNSNLILLNSSVAKSLKECGLTSVLTSVLSCDEEIHDNISYHKGSWKKTIAGIKTALDEGLRVSANMVLLKQNYGTLYETGIFLNSLGVKTFTATKASPSLNARNFDEIRLGKEQIRESLQILERIKKETNMNIDILECYPLCLIQDISKFSYFARRSCTAGISTSTISAYGDVRPCSHSDMNYGDIFEEDFSKIWSRMSDWRECSYVPEECKSCKFVMMCSGGCRMEAKYRGDICSKDPYMTGPEDVVYKGGFAEDGTEQATSQIETKQLYKLSEGTILRKESFGGILSSKLSGSVLLNKDGYKIVETIAALAGNNFTVLEIGKGLDLDIDKLMKFLGILKRKKAIMFA